MEVVGEGGTMLTVTQSGYGKRTELEEYRLQSRGGVGIINIQTSERNGKVVGISYVHDDDELMLISQQGMILRMVAKDVRAIGRVTQGVRLLGVDEGDEVVSVARLAEKEVEENGDDRRRSRDAGNAGRSNYAGSSFAYFDSSFFNPTEAKRTVTFRSSLCSSTAITVPTPNCW